MYFVWSIIMITLITKSARLSTRTRVRPSLNMSVSTASTKQLKHVLAFDFDGVICASSEESSYTSIIAAQKAWPTVFKTLDESSIEFKSLRKSINQLRPIIETGYENMLIARYLYEEKVTVDNVLKSWNSSLRDNLIDKYGYSKNTLINAFGDMRDILIQTRLQDWIGMNKIYPEIANTLKSLQMNLSPNTYIITTKQARFVLEIFQGNNIPCVTSDRIFDLENPYGPKPKVLQALSQQYQSFPSSTSSSTSADTTTTNTNPSATIPDVTIHFIEDRYETLVTVANIPELHHVQLYLVDWGYNTKEQQQEALIHPRIKLINPSQFNTLIQTIQSHT